MAPMHSLPLTLTMADVMRDLESGRTQPLRPLDRLLGLPSRRRPVVGGLAFLGAYGAAKGLGRVHPRLARRALMRLWLTPWVHPSTRRPVTELSADLRPWSLPQDGVVLRGFTGGTGPTAVLIHGWAGRAADWRHLAGDLIEAGWRVVAPDLPAHGATAGTTTDAFALGDAAAAVLRHERPAAVIAHSMGFPITLLALERGAPPPASLITLAPGRRMLRALERFSEQARLAPALVDELHQANQQRFGADVWDVLDVDRVVGDLTPRGLVVHDGDDEDVPVTDGEHIATHWPGATFVRTDGLGHRRILRDAAVRTMVIDALR